MQLSFFTRLDPAPAPDWVAESSDGRGNTRRWVRYHPPFRLAVQQDLRDGTWQWWCHRWPGREQRQGGEVTTPQEGARFAEAALKEMSR